MSDETNSETPRTRAIVQLLRQMLNANGEAWFALRDGVIAGIEDLERELAAVTRERNGARALNAEWAKKAQVWLASPEAAKQLASYRELGQRAADAENKCDALRAQVEGLREALEEIRDGDGAPAWCRETARAALSPQTEEPKT